MMMHWRSILNIQEATYPDWRNKKPRLLYSTALAGECGELCGVVTHLEGGGTNLLKYTEKMILEEAADVWIQLVLLLARSGFSKVDFENALSTKLSELRKRLEEKKSKIVQSNCPKIQYAYFDGEPFCSTGGKWEECPDPKCVLKKETT